MVSNSMGKAQARPDCDPDGVVKDIFQKLEDWINSDPSEGDLAPLTKEDNQLIMTFNKCVESPPGTTEPATSPPSEFPWLPVAIGGGALAIAAAVILR